MTTLRRILVGLLSLLMAAPSAFASQQHVVDPSQLAAAVAEHAAAQDADRAAIVDVLSRPEVRDVASKMAIDVDRVAASAMILSGPDLDRAAATARQVAQQVDAQFVGGASNIVISTTTLIIILLLVILLVIALK